MESNSPGVPNCGYSHDNILAHLMLFVQQKLTKHGPVVLPPTLHTFQVLHSKFKVATKVQAASNIMLQEVSVVVSTNALNNSTHTSL
jgi:hypothetical protein